MEKAKSFWVLPNQKRLLCQNGGPGHCQAPVIEESKRRTEEEGDSEITMALHGKPWCGARLSPGNLAISGWSKRSLDEMPGSVLSVSENSCYSLTADLPRLLIMLPCDVILTHTEALTTSVCRAQICPQRVGQCFYLALFWACSLAMMFCCQAFGCHANFSALNHNLSTAGDQKPFQV